MADNIILDKPLQFIHIIKENAASRIYPRIFLNIGTTSEVNVLQSEIGKDNNSHFINGVVEVIVNENAQLVWNHIQNRNYKTGQVSSFNLGLEKNASAIYNLYDFGGGFIRRDVHVNLHDTGGNFEFNSLFVSDTKQHIDITSIINHEESHCTSKQLVKGILGGTSTGVFRGLAHVFHEASKTDANQMNHNLLLSPNARMNSIPKLEIYEGDVKCSHGSTTGKIDDEALFYLRSRGITLKESLNLMIKGFASEIVNKVNHPDIKSYIFKSLIRKLEKMKL